MFFVKIIQIVQIPQIEQIVQNTMSDFLLLIQEVSYEVLDYFRILRPKKCLQDFTRNFEDFERGDSLL